MFVVVNDVELVQFEVIAATSGMDMLIGGDLKRIPLSPSLEQMHLQACHRV
jgi:hypothetical protein